ncbi:MAG: family 43 glycosylhydrolase [Actinomyces sp.]|jgi:hypothetical protein|nr:family 43 glycosylhydrolase [Actinomyces sp.]MCI1641889.1 family 43 glycosylhydrolase [Actinomyces sp.]MCI1661902.1 family 43 glycosylhydrolase [Actinomyces sp.]MCI1691266.1 family 43 glycosylhydrolase [Actinomyces sp.]MCI1787705.1 family 43 glycosylhydrolase [Actinomyces sp.]MCI1830388.1 family 43 glycosylhydrolase [Actinomyces sp.]
MTMDHTIVNGRPWFDRDGARIQAHAGAIIFEDDTFYWYGENKDHTTGKGRIWTWGIRCYSSKDLASWKDLGLIIPPVLDDRRSPLHPTRRIDRPHILRNPRTGKYVCWLKENGKNARFHVLVADSLLGPYELVRQDWKPGGRVAGDFDLAQDPETGTATLMYCSEWEGVFCSPLTDDYLDVTGEWSVSHTGLHPPYSREGVTMFERQGRRYVLTSGMSGYVPNPSQVDVADDWQGPFTALGDPHVDDASSSSFNSQISQVFKHPKKDDLYIALADRWVPDYVMTRERYEWLSRTIASHYDKSVKSSLRDTLQLLRTPLMGKANTSLSEYIWLPLRFENGEVRIDWKSEWSIDDYA